MENFQDSPGTDGMKPGNGGDNGVNNINVLDLFQGAMGTDRARQIRDSSSAVLSSISLTLEHESVQPLPEKVHKGDRTSLKTLLSKIAELPDTCISTDTVKDNKEAAELMKSLDVREIVVVRDGDKSRFVIRFNSRKSIEMPPEEGCRRVDIDSTVSGTISKTATGISIENIKGVKATIDCDSEWSLLVGNTVSVDVTKAALRTNGDDTPSIEVTGNLWGLERKVEIELPEQILRQADQMKKLLCDLQNNAPVDEALRKQVFEETRENGFRFLGMSAVDLTVGGIISALLIRRQFNRTSVNAVDSRLLAIRPGDLRPLKDVAPFYPPPTRVVEQFSRSPQNIGKLTPAEFNQLLDSHIRELREKGLPPRERETLKQFEEQMKSEKSRAMLQNNLAAAKFGGTGDTASMQSLERPAKTNPNQKNVERPLAPQVIHAGPAGSFSLERPGKSSDKGLPGTPEAPKRAKSYERTIHRGGFPTLGKVAGAFFLAEAVEQAYERFIK